MDIHSEGGAGGGHGPSIGGRGGQGPSIGRGGKGLGGATSIGGFCQIGGPTLTCPASITTGGF